MSIDAVVAQIEAALPNWWWSVGMCKRENHAHVCPEGVDHDGYEAFGETPAHALRAAFEMALAARKRECDT